MLPLMLAAVVLSVLELDRHTVGMAASRPMVVGPVLGLALGHLEVGAVIGVLIELMSLESVPLGAELGPNATIAAGAALLLALGPEAGAVPLSFALPAGLFAGRAFKRLETRMATARASYSREADRSLERGVEPPYGEYVRAALTAQCIANAVFFFSVIFLARPFLSWGWHFTPHLIQKGLTFALSTAPILALATLMNSLRPSKGSIG
jgi:mannose/fructose/N-acetylgalactosamine-specific phosphotransferase system component IIC